jgi:hypothetical protein
MSDSFELPVTYKGKDFFFPSELISTGYSYKILVNVFDMIVSYEPDEERNFRAILTEEFMQDAHKIDKGILEEIANSLISIFKDH